MVRAEINIHNTNYSAIRVYDIKDYEHVLSLQKAFASEGIKFKSKTTNIEGSFEMKIWKVFLLENTQPGIYMNRSKSKMSYFEINKHLSWTHFKAITKKVKSNWTGKSFDAALGMIYRKHGLEEVVRVFSNAIDENMTVELKSLYDKFIESEK
ncbi:MAG: hypothetical protein IPO21_18795 [Bacteroidales bacterium]|nr:hypothetical protein [Bacteroidales bacterium]